jgi:hypothetical protein
MALFWQQLRHNPEDAPTGTGGDTPENWERSRAEVKAFKEEKPDKYFVYIKEGVSDIGGSRAIATTWMGHKLGDVFLGRPFKSNMGDVRVPITVRGINGVTYVGTYYKSAGDYARIRRKRGR